MVAHEVAQSGGSPKAEMHALRVSVCVCAMYGHVLCAGMCRVHNTTTARLSEGQTQRALP